MTSFNGLKQVAQETTTKLIDKAAWIGMCTIAVLLSLWLGSKYITANVHFSPVVVTTTSDVPTILISGVRDISEFTTARTDITATVKMDKHVKALELKILDFNFNGIPVGGTHLVYEGVGTVRAGIDIKQVEMLEVDNVERKIRILLPSPKITEVFLDVKHSSPVASYREWFGPKAGAELYSEAEKEALAEIRDKACANHILEAANDNAKQLIESILTKASFTTVEIETQMPQEGSCPSI